MPVRSLNSSVLRWPDAATVDRALRKWAAEVVAKRKNVLRIGYFGSYARDDWGVRSDIDLVVVVETAWLWQDPPPPGVEALREIGAI